MKYFTFLFSENLISEKENPTSPMQSFIREMQIYFQIVVKEISLNECCLGFKDDSLHEDMIIRISNGIIKTLFSVENAESVLSISTKNESIHKQQTNVLNKISRLVGGEEFKSLARECVHIAPRLKKYNAEDSFIHRSYLFSINEGDGLTTYLNLFADLLEEVDLFSFASSEKVVEERVYYDGKGKEGSFSAVLSHMYGFSQKGKIICIDISEWMTKTNEPSFRDFLLKINNYTDKFIFVFRIPFVEKEILEKIKHDISDVLFVQELTFAPFSKEELRVCAEDILSKRGFEMEEAAWNLFEARIIEEKSDGRFYGINTIIKIVREMIYRKLVNNATHDADDYIIKRCEIEGLAKSYNIDSKSGLDLLDEFVGMEEIKKRVSEIVTQIEISIKDNKIERPCIHMRFVGNPGTGKTTVARVVGQVLKEKGVLRNGSFFEYSGRDFCGRYVGETAPKTAAMCRDAYGSVLFIDEAYSLNYDGHNSNIDYGREAIDTLIGEMENHRSDLVVIMAGYPKEMDDLMMANAGLESRMPYIIEFSNYSKEQLYKIYIAMVEKRFLCDEEFKTEAKNYFESISEEAITAKEFSNARFVRNLFERTWGKAVMRCQLNKIECNKLTKEDFVKASRDKEFSQIVKKQSVKMGF